MFILKNIHVLSEHTLTLRPSSRVALRLTWLEDSPDPTPLAAPPGDILGSSDFIETFTRVMGIAEYVNLPTLHCTPGSLMIMFIFIC